MDAKPAVSSNSETKLQFDKAEYEQPKGGASCAVCKCDIPDSYYEVNGQIACATCRERLEKVYHGGSGTKRFLRALIYGIAAGMVGFALWFAVAHFLNLESGLVAIVVGLLVGAAVKKGSEGRGGWRYQALAMFITYSSIVSTYIPVAFVNVRDEYDLRKATTVQTQESSATSAGVAAEPVNSNSPVKRALFLVIITGLLFVLAFIAPVTSGLSNIVGLIIIAIALYEAWVLNRRLTINISGPYQVSVAPPAAPQAAAT